MCVLGEGGGKIGVHAQIRLVPVCASKLIFCLERYENASLRGWGVGVS